MKKLTVCAIQTAIDSDEKEANFERIQDRIREAAALGAKLIVMQELHATRYFCQTEDVDCFDLAEPLDGPTFNQFKALAEELELVIVISGFEKRAAGIYHNTAQVIDGGRGRAGIYRKMHIPDDPGFYEKFYFTPGDANLNANAFKAIETSVGRLGVLICWDQWFPEAARLSALSGADVLIYPTAIGWDPDESEDENARQQEAWLTIQRSHAIANGLPIIVANRVGFEESPNDADSGIEFWGSSFVAGPQGEILAQASCEDEEILCTVIDLERSEKVRRVWPYLRDRRIDAYQNLTKRYID